MKKNFEAIYSFIIVLFTVYVLLDTFVIEKKYLVVEDPSNYVQAVKSDTIIPSAEKHLNDIVVSNDSFYADTNMTIALRGYYEYNSAIYVAEIEVKDSKLLKTAFAKSSYGRNITEKTSVMANRVNAILAINGDYYGVQERGYVLRNGVIYRNTPVSQKDDLVIYEDGRFEIIYENEVTLERLLEIGAYQVLSFGPTLVKNGQVSISSTEENRKANYGNPRTAIGVLANGHYVFVVSDGRTDKSVGLSLDELAEFMNKLGCQTAYNLDGGGSTTMYFNGKVVNNPTTYGDRINERSISDIVYVGY